MKYTVPDIFTILYNIKKNTKKSKKYNFKLIKNNYSKFYIHYSRLSLIRNF